MFLFLYFPAWRSGTLFFRLQHDDGRDGEVRARLTDCGRDGRWTAGVTVGQAWWYGCRFFCGGYVGGMAGVMTIITHASFASGYV